ncbi:hypothetical protein B0H13DRAFT_1878555 [Mycena leptocephala]|nr:hypothetical protein B0H13DRAFT_1878555 [Mycena leptocephala]
MAVFLMVSLLVPMSLVSPPSLDEPVALAALPNDAILAPVAPRTSSVPKPGPLVVVAEKLERLAARLRRPNKIASPSLVDLEEAVDAMLLATDHLAVLPSTQYFAPVVKQSSARQAMLPGIKTRRARAGDKAYGAGAGSGALAKPDAKAAKTAKKAKKAKTATTPLPPVPPASDAQQQQPSAVYYPAHFNPFYYPAQYQLPYYPATSTTEGKRRVVLIEFVELDGLCSSVILMTYESANLRQTQWMPCCLK